jgi:hypothetical protein
LETKHAYGLVLETLAPFSAISCQASGHSHVGPPDAAVRGVVVKSFDAKAGVN